MCRLSPLPVYVEVARLPKIDYTVAIIQYWLMEGMGMDYRKNTNVLGKVGCEEDRLYVNRFIMFYTLRFLWKCYKNPVPELHSIMFSGGNVTEGRTSYNKMLKIDTYVKDAVAKKCEDTTGVDQRYFTGERPMVVADLSLNTWWRFVELWNNRKDDERQEFIKLESEIHEKLRKASVADLAKQQEVFRVLAYFAKNKSKKSTHTTLERLTKLEKQIEEFTKRELELVDKDRLEAHRQVLREYTDRITAISILNGWK